MGAWDLGAVWEQMKHEARDSVRGFQDHVYHNPLPVALEARSDVGMSSIFKVARLCEMPVPKTQEELQQRAVALKEVVDQLALARQERDRLRGGN